MIPKSMKHLATADLSKFEDLALDQAAYLVKCYLYQRVEFLKENVQVYYHPASGRVFLADERFHIAMADNGDLKQWATCQVCGKEGFIDAENPKFLTDSLCMPCCVSDE